jgi:hypothetical protein
MYGPSKHRLVISVAVLWSISFRLFLIKRCCLLHDFSSAGPGPMGFA